MGFSTASAGSQAGLYTQAAGALFETAGAYKGAKGSKAGYEAQAKIAEGNAQISEWQAQDAEARGVIEQQNIQLRTAQLRGTQEAIFGARNVATTEGSALNILADTEFLGKRDQNTAGDNAAKEAWGHRVQASNYRSNSALSRWQGESVNPFMVAAGTGLSAAGRVASSWYKTKASTSGGGSRPNSAGSIDPYATA